MTTYHEFEDYARAVRQGHQGRTSRGLSVEIARFALDNPIFGDDRAELLADLKRCAANAIGAGCEPRLRPLPGQKDPGASLAAPAQVNQVEGTTPLTSPARRPLPGQSAGVACLAAVAQVNQVEGITPLPRLLRSPVGAWVHLHTKRYFTFFKTCGVPTKQGVLTSERRA